MSELKCKKHGIELSCMGGRSAHRSNWYCVECDKEEPKPLSREKVIAYARKTKANNVECGICIQVKDLIEEINSGRLDEE